MRRHLIPLLASLMLAWGLARSAPAQQPPARPDVEIYLVPEKDVFRTPGFESEGLFVPLSEISQLAQAALARSESERKSLGLQVTQLRLKGTLQPSRLLLSGEIFYEAQSPGWVALPIGDSGVQWTRQQSPDGRAYLVNVGQHTFLYVRGKSSGTIAVEAQWEIPVDQTNPSIDLGRFEIPARIDISITPSDQPSPFAFLDASCIHDIRPDGSGSSITIWPASGKPTQLRLSRVVPLQARGAYMVIHNLKIGVLDSGIGLAMQIIHTFELQGQFKPGLAVAIQLPDGVFSSDIEVPSPVDLRFEGRTLQITPRQNLDVIEIRGRFIRQTTDGALLVEPWTLDAAAQHHEVFLEHSPSRFVVLDSIPDSLHESAAASQPDANQAPAPTRYLCDASLPALDVRIRPRGTLLPPRVDGNLRIDPGVANCMLSIYFDDLMRRDASLEIPDGWNLMSITALGQQNQNLPITLFQQDSRQWKIHVRDASILSQLTVQMRRLGAGSGTGESEIEFPVINVNSERVRAYRVNVSWSNALDVRASGLQGVEQVALEPIPNPAAQQQVAQRSEPGIRPSGLILKAVASNPSAVLNVRRREPDLQAQVYTVLSVEPDRAVVRSSIEWTVRYAPASAFRFLLPAGTGENVRIDGADLRESNREVTPMGDQWTLVTQNAVGDTWRVLLEWPLQPSPDGRLRAPEIEIPGVTSSKGYLVLEGAESLRLDVETSNLAEVDISELPADPWAVMNRRLAAWQYVAPPFELAVSSRQFASAKPLDGLVSEARLITTVTADGLQLTQAEYDFARTADRQFFEVVLPNNASVWSVLVDGRGEKPAHRDLGGVDQLLVPLPVGSSIDESSHITVLYSQPGPALAEVSDLELDAPELTVPVVRTFWDLNLPAGFEYLSFSARHADTYHVHTPLVTYLSEASYKENLIFLDVPLPVVVTGTVLVVIGLFVSYFLWRKLRVRMEQRRLQAQLESAAPSPPQESKIPSAVVTRLTELLVILFVLAILAAIAVPNFLEAQSRAKVSRVRSDQRTLATALEAYFVDNNTYPSDLSILWQGPVKYIADGFTDPFTVEDNRRWGRTGFNYINGREAVDAAVSSGILDPQALRDPSSAQGFWIVWAVGPDGRDDGGRIMYDPTNGTTSAGDVIRIAQNSSFDNRYAAERFKDQADLGRNAQGFVDGESEYESVQERQSAQAASDRKPQGARAGVNVESNRGIPQADAEESLPQRGEPLTRRSSRPDINGPANVDELTLSESAPVVEDLPSPFMQDLDGSAAANGFVYEDAFNLNSFVGDDFATDGAIQWSYESAGAALYSINGSASPQGAPNVDYSGPNGGIGGLQAVEAGLLSLDIEIPVAGYQHRFEILGPETQVQVELMSERSYLSLRFVVWFTVWLAMLIAYLRSPLLYRRVFIALIAVVLIVPLLYRGTSVFWFSSIFQGMMLSLIVPLLHHLVVRRRLVSTPASHASSLMPLLFFALSLIFPSAFAQQPETPIRIVMPYDGQPDVDPNANAYISRQQFEALWRAAQRAPRSLSDSPAFVASLDLTASLDPVRSQSSGELTLVAFNTSDRASSIPLSLSQLSIDRLIQLPEGIRLESTDSGLLLNLAPATSGTVVCSFQAPVSFNGNTGSMLLDFPDVASGRWAFSMPFNDVQLTRGRAIKSTSESGGTILSGPVQPGPLSLVWQAVRSASTGSEADSFRASIDTSVVWDFLSSARWNARIHLSSLDANQSLPETVRLPMSAPVMLSDASGQLLQSVTQQDESILLRLRPAPEADITLTGWFIHDDSGRWTIPAIRMSRESFAPQSLQLSISQSLQPGPLSIEGLTRSPIAEKPDYRVLSFNASNPDWSCALSLEPIASVYDAFIHALHVPVDGFLRSVYHVSLQPRSGQLYSWSLELPEGESVETVTESNQYLWYQQGRTLHMQFQHALQGPLQFDLIARRDFSVDTSRFELAPAHDKAAQKVTYDLTLSLPHDRDLLEQVLVDAAPRVPGNEVVQLFRLLGLYGPDWPSRLRSYRLQSTSAAQSFQWIPIETGASVDVFNLFAVHEGLATLSSRFQIEPRRGRVQQIEGRIRLAVPDANLPNRLRCTGPVRNLRTEPIDELNYQVFVELDAPRSSAFSLDFHYDQAANTADGQSIPAMFMMPASGSGSRTWLLVRPDITGELNLAESVSGLRPIELDPAKWRAAGMDPRPSDRGFEFSSAAPPVASFSIVRHARDESLRAIVEMLRNRCIVTIDGIQRNEIEMVVQNLSEQFLRIELPYDPQDIEIYEVRVAGKVVRINLATVAGRPVLTVPLIRTGLLDPELTIRVAYIARTQSVFRRKGRDEFRMPQILDGVPVAQAAMVLMLPSGNEYTDFGGSMQQVELLNLEIDETLRRTRKIEQISEAALVADKEVQAKAVKKLESLYGLNDAQVLNMRNNNEIYSRNQSTIQISENAPRDNLSQSESKLSKERISNLDRAAESQQNIFFNIGKLQQQVVLLGDPAGDAAQSQVSPDSGAAQSVPDVELPDLKFPRQGVVFAFRQIQGAGNVTLRYKSDRIAGNRRDMIAALGLVVFIALLVYNAGRVFSTRRGVALFLGILGILILWAGMIPDVAVILLGAALVLGLWPASRSNQSPINY